MTVPERASSKVTGVRLLKPTLVIQIYGCFCVNLRTKTANLRTVFLPILLWFVAPLFLLNDLNFGSTRRSVGDTCVTCFRSILCRSAETTTTSSESDFPSGPPLSPLPPGQHCCFWTTTISCGFPIVLVDCHIMSRYLQVNLQLSPLHSFCVAHCWIKGTIQQICLIGRPYTF